MTAACWSRSLASEGNLGVAGGLILTVADAAASSSSGGVAFYEILTILSAIAAVLVAVISFLYSRRRDSSKDRVAQIQGIAKDVVASSVEGFISKIEKNERDIADINSRVAPALLAATDKLNLVSDRTGALEGKVDEINRRVVPSLQSVTDRLSTVADRTGVLETKIDVFWKNVAYDAARILHSPHTPELDNLLERYQAQIITSNEKAALADMLREILDSREAPTGNRIAAVIILRVLEGET